MRFGWRARIGQLRPSSAIEGAEEWRRVAPEGVAFIEARLLVRDLSEQGHDDMMAQVLGEARKVATAQPDVIIQCSAPGIFMHGVGRDKQVIAEIEKETGVQATTMMTSVVDAMRALGMRRIVVGTLYIDSINQKLVRFLEDSGFEVAAIKGLGLLVPQECIYPEDDTSYRLCKEVLKESNDSVDGIVFCSGLRTFQMIQTLETDTGLPVVTSNQASLWKVLRMAHVPESLPRLGRLFEVA